jgi:hypothetical protein
VSVYSRAVNLYDKIPLLTAFKDLTYGS